jgi:micrococcal nuclease
VNSEQVTVAYVFDGDTVELSDGRKVRYIGLNTPERDQPFYEEAREANRKLVEGMPVLIELDVQVTDRYGRLLAYVWVGEQLVNLELVRQGYGSAYTQAPNLRHTDAILAAEQEARAAQVGLWLPADVPVKIRFINYDAPGADHLNPNGEWVELVNEGTEAVDLSGFSLKDEANHIYTFDAVHLEPGEALAVHSGVGQDGPGSVYWGLIEDAIWSNGGDTAYLRDPEGRLVDIYGYGRP